MEKICFDTEKIITFSALSFLAFLDNKMFVFDGKFLQGQITVLAANHSAMKRKKILSCLFVLLTSARLEIQLENVCSILN